MGFSIKVDDRSLKEFSRAMREQVPFATAVALTRTAAQAKDAVQEGLKTQFLLRNQFTKNSIRSQRAEKRDWPNPSAIVGSIAPYMAIQEEGGSKSPIGKAFSIPKGIRTSEKRIVPKSKWPSALLEGQNVAIPMGGKIRGAKKGSKSKPKPFLIQEHDGVGLYVRTGKGRKLKRLYRITRQTMHVRAHHWLEKPVTRIVTENLHDNFVRALDEAMSTSR